MKRVDRWVGCLLPCLVAVFLMAPWAMRAADFDAYCHWVPLGTKRTVAWNAHDGVTGYELRIRRLENGKTVRRERLTATQRKITWRESGHYVAYVRWYKTTNNVDSFGEWYNSLDGSNSMVMIGTEWVTRPWVLIVPTAK